MDGAQTSEEAGGFMEPALLSPPPSSHASSSAASALPRPRNSPLKAGGSKESSLIRYVDQGILHIQRRFAKREAPGQDIDDGGDGTLVIKGTVRPEIAATNKDNTLVGYK